MHSYGSHHIEITAWNLGLRENLSHSASQETPRLLWKPKVHYRVHKKPPLLSILRQNPSISVVLC